MKNSKDVCKSLIHSCKYRSNYNPIVPALKTDLSQNVPFVIIMQVLDISKNSSSSINADVQSIGVTSSWGESIMQCSMFREVPLGR